VQLVTFNVITLFGRKLAVVEKSLTVVFTSHNSINFLGVESFSDCNINDITIASDITYFSLVASYLCLDTSGSVPLFPLLNFHNCIQCAIVFFTIVYIHIVRAQVSNRRYILVIFIITDSSLISVKFYTVEFLRMNSEVEALKIFRNF
jgi:hypothetical protein